MSITESSNIWHVTGPPGCGKTQFLASETQKAVINRGRRVAIASLTNTAAAEIRARTAIKDRNQIDVGTLHKLCMKALGINREQLVASHLESWRDFCDHPSWRLSGSDRAETRGDELIAVIEHARHRMVEPESWPPLVGLSPFWETYCKWKKETDLYDFTDLIEMCVADGVLPIVGHGKPDTVVIDEAQDSTPLELKLVREVWAPHIETTILAGDPDQSIFSFRGCDPRMFMDFPHAGDKLLEQSYRVPRAVHTQALRMIRRISDRVDVQYLPRDADGEVIRSSAFSNDPSSLIRQIPRWLEDGSVLFLGATQYQLFATLAMLRAEGIPFSNPWTIKRGDWNPLLHRRRDTVTTLDRFLSFISGWKAWKTEDIQQWLGLLHATGLLTRGAKGKPKLSPHWTLSELRALFISEVDFDKAMDADLEWLLANAPKDRKRVLEYASRIFKRSGRKALEDPPQVHIGTVHSVKGGEASTVILFPDITFAMYQSGDVATQVRTFYVGITRARHRLVLCAPASRMHFSL